MLGLPLSWDGEAPRGWAKLAPDSELNKLLKWGLVLGASIGQIRPDGSLFAWPMQWARYDVQARQWYVQTDKGEQPIRPGDGTWIVYTPYGSFEPWNEGLWTQLAVPFLVKRYALNDRARASEVFGSAMIVGNPPEGATEVQRKRFLTELKGLSRSTRLVLPEGYSIDLLEAQGQTWGIYAQGIDWADTAITVAIAGQIVTTEGQSGFSRGDIHEAIAHSLVRFGARTFGACLADQYVARVWQTPATPVWDISSPTATLAAAQSLSAFGDALEKANRALHNDGLKIDARALAGMFGVPLLPRFEESSNVNIQFAPERFNAGRHYLPT